MQALGDLLRLLLTQRDLDRVQNHVQPLFLKQNKMNFGLLHHFDSGLTENDINKRHSDEKR